MTVHLPTRGARKSSRWRSTTLRFSPAPFVALTLLALTWGCLASEAHAQGGDGAAVREPGGRLTDPVVRAADVAAPAVVRIATLYTSHITLSVCGKSIMLPTASAGYTEGVLGSGAFVSANGDVLTADHLIDVDHATLEQQLFADPAAQNDIATALNTSPCFGFGPAIQPGDIANGFLQTSGVGFTTNFTDPVTSVWRDTWYSGPLGLKTTDTSDIIKNLQAAPHDQASVVAKSDFTHDDLAVLHVDERDTPSLTLGNSANVQTLDGLTIIGFPGNGDANNDPTNLLTPSFNSANVSAIKTNDDGAELIQVGGNIEHGDSGGPALDASGHIVGVVSFGGPDNQGITAFLRSSDSARSLIASAKVSMRAGAFERNWERAFSDYAATYPGHWRRASQELAALLKQYPQFHGVDPYAAWARTQAKREPLPQRRVTLTPIVVVALALIAALALGVIGVTLLRATRETPPLLRRVAQDRQPGSSIAPLYVPPIFSDEPGGSLLDSLDDPLTSSTQRMS